MHHTSATGTSELAVFPPPSSQALELDPDVGGVLRGVRVPVPGPPVLHRDGEGPPPHPLCVPREGQTIGTETSIDIINIHKYYNQRNVI